MTTNKHLTSDPSGIHKKEQRGFVSPEEWEPFRAFVVCAGESFEEAVIRLILEFCKQPPFEHYNNFLMAYLEKGSARGAADATETPKSTAIAWARRFNDWVTKHGLALAKRKERNDEYEAERAAERQRGRELRDEERLYWVREVECARLACAESCGRKGNKHKKMVKAERGNRKPNGRYYYKPALAGRCPSCPMLRFEGG